MKKIAFTLALLLAATAVASADVPTGTLPVSKVAGIGDSLMAGWIDDAAAYDLSSVGYFYAPDAPHSYLSIAAALARSTPTNLASGGAYCSDVTANQVPLIPLDSTTVVIGCGTNDVFKYGGGSVADWDGTVAAVQARVPNAALVFVTLRRMDSFNKGAIVHAWNDHVRTKHYVTRACVVELEFDPKWYDKTFPDDQHPDLLGVANMGYAVAPCIR